MALIDDVTKEVIDGNKAKRYKHNTKEMFKAWLNNCPVKIKGSSETIGGKGAEAGEITITFEQYERK
jgi:hypothetical protein|tara:strand:+ start:281 stop:481 length:201 start_codon:yes stop_codon:yes gene_type:complete